MALADLNDDGWTDIFIANDTQRNFVYFNKGDGTFEDASYTSGAGFSEDGKTEAGMSAGCRRRRWRRRHRPVREPSRLRAQPPLPQRREAVVHRRHHHFGPGHDQHPEQQLRRPLPRRRQRRQPRPARGERPHPRQHRDLPRRGDPCRGQEALPEPRRGAVRRRDHDAARELPRAACRPRPGRRRLRQRRLPGLPRQQQRRGKGSCSGTRAPRAGTGSGSGWSA